MKRWCLFDTEATGLMLPDDAPIDNQPRIVEFAGIIVDDNLEILDSLEFKVHPGIKLPDDFIKITKITDAELVGLPRYIEYHDKLKDFIYSADVWVAHNIMYDYGVLNTEFKRLGEYIEPKMFYCTVEQTMHIKNKRLKLSHAYEFFTGKKPPVSHRAMSDVITMFEVFKNIVFCE
jgi:DNA polymerase III epsilon subunit-like protein